MAKGRIGLSLDEDVLAILNEYGRSEVLQGASLHPNFRCGAWCDYPDGELWKSEEQGIYARPTRTKIIEIAMREWAARQVKAKKQ